jgi:hypothetical protein
VKAIKSASIDELLALSWLPENVARNVHAHFHSEEASDALPGKNGV